MRQLDRGEPEAASAPSVAAANVCSGFPRHPLPSAASASHACRASNSACSLLMFSAGGRMVAAVSTHFDRRAYAPVDAADQQSCRPDGHRSERGHAPACSPE
jgi:hypothetical protein